MDYNIQPTREFRFKIKPLAHHGNPRRNQQSAGHSFDLGGGLPRNRTILGAVFVADGKPVRTGRPAQGQTHHEARGRSVEDDSGTS